jgi:hypothetical protein
VLTESAGAPVAPVPLASERLLEKETLFGRVLAAIDQFDLKMQLQSEFAGLCNSLIVADRKKVSHRQALQEIVKKACGYISIGLENLADDHRRLIRTFPLADIFRVGYGQVLALKWKVDAWHKESWFAQANLRLSFWGETYMGVIGGLMIPKPLYFDNYATGTIYREFETAEDIRITEALLNQIMSLDKLFDLLGVEEPRDQTQPPLTYQNLLLTMWAAHCSGLFTSLPVGAAIPLEAFKAHFATLWNRRHPPAIQTAAKSSFAQWIADSSGMTLGEVSWHYGEIFTDLFKEIEDEFATIAIDDLDPRFIHLFRIQQ